MSDILHEQHVTDVPQWEKLEVSLLMALPELPVEVSQDAATGQMSVKERDRVQELGMPQKQDAPLYELHPVGDERLQELDEIARQLGFENALAFAERGTFASEVLHSDEIAPVIKRYVTENMPPWNVVKVMRDSAFEQAYADRMLAAGRELLQRYLPEFVPKEATAAVGERGRLGPGNHYWGKFGGYHVLAVEASRVRQKDIDAIDHPDSERVISAAHELLHQTHCEHSGGPILQVDLPAVPREALEQTVDPYAAYKMAEAYYRSIRGTPQTSAQRVVSCVVETLAYLGEAVIEEGQHRPVAQYGITGLHEAYAEMARRVVYDTPAADRLSVMRQLLAIDLPALSGLPEAELQAAATDPQAMLALPKSGRQE